MSKRLSQAAERVNPVASVHIWRSPPHSAVEMLIVTHLSVYSTIHEHATAALPNETGGFLIGRVAHDVRDGCWLLEIEEAIPVRPESQDPVHFTFTWRDVDRVRSYREGSNKALIGWFHTHPHLGIFLSETDIERTHRVLFSDPFQVALVFDPVGGRAGYFFWEGAQTIDASQGAWREFEIAVRATPEPAADESTPAGPGEAPAPAVEQKTDAPQNTVSTAPAAAAPAPEVAAPGVAIGEATQTSPPRLEAGAVNVVAGSTHRDRRLWWALLAGVCCIIIGLAVGYFWFGPGRGLR